MEKCAVCKNMTSDLNIHFQTNHPSEYRKLKQHHEENGDGGDFLISAVIGAATGSALLGGLLGGDLLGGIVGDFFGGDD
jgi:hypothetical protein